MPKDMAMLQDDEGGESRTEKKRTATVKKSKYELRKLSRKWGTYRVMWHYRGRESLLADSKKAASRGRAGEAACEQVKPKKT